MNFGDPTNEADSIQITHAALGGGINFVDMANGYNAGQSEIILGKALNAITDFHDSSGWMKAAVI